MGIYDMKMYFNTWL